VDLTSFTLPDARPHAIITEAEDGGVETMGYEVANTGVSGWSSSHRTRNLHRGATLHEDT
ncbi:hypothetical protein FIBSPDRAFT_859201, partial [Athelia psychrophila]